MEVIVENQRTVLTPYYFKYGEYNSLCVNLSNSNCKLAIVESGGVLTNIDKKFTEDNRKELLDKVFKTLGNRNILFHLIDKKLAEWLRDNYTHYYYNVVPCGYGTGDQYHILLKNNNDKRDPIITTKEVIKEITKEVVPTAKIVDLLEETMNETISRKQRTKLFKTKLDKLNNI